MDITSQPKVVLSILFFISSILIALLLIPSQFYFPSLGFCALFSAIASLAFFAKKQKSKFDFALYAGLLLLSLFLVLRANFFLNFLDIVTILIAGSYFLSRRLGVEGIFSLLFSPISSLVRITQTKNDFPYKSLPMTPDAVKKMRLGQHIPAVIITIILLLVVVPLLSYANPFFQKLVTDLTQTLDLTGFFKNFTNNFFIYLLRLIVFLLLLYLLPRGVTDQIEMKEKKKVNSLGLHINLLLPKVVLSAILVVFFITQLQLYFSSADTLRSLGYTNSQYAREVFGQLSFVAFIIFALMYADRSKSKFSRYLTTLLIIEGVFLCSIAFKSVFDYTQQYGFTSKRLYGYAGVTWIIGLVALFAYHYFKNTFGTRFIKHLVGYTTIIVLCINFSNFDYIIYHYAKPQVFGTDYEYLSRLSSDAHSYHEQVQVFTYLIQKEKDPERKNTYLYAMPRVVGSIAYLQRKYTHLPLGAFNFSEYREFMNTKDVDTTKLYDFLAKHQPQNPPQSGIITPQVTITETRMNTSGK